jgi:hypothetical protein
VNPYILFEWPKRILPYNFGGAKIESQFLDAI